MTIINDLALLLLNSIQWRLDFTNNVANYKHLVHSQSDLKTKNYEYSLLYEEGKNQNA